MPADTATSGDPFDALADSNRREILRILSAGERPVNELASELPISRPAVSRHLRLLSDAGLVSERQQGTRRIYSLRQEGAQAVQAYLETLWGEAGARFRLMAENTTPENRTAENTTPANGAGDPTSAEGTWQK
ncbi:MAG: transcriptional regulator, ArsR family [Subtercola sp.]|nr:transcriptional regulator, ArsR family [Subtercola sp.]